MITPSKAALAAAVAAGILSSGASAANDTTKEFCNKYFCTTLTYSPSSSTLKYNITGVSGVSPSWVSVGTGTRMAGSTMWMTWPASDGSVVLSERTASGHNAPSISRSPIATQDSSASIASTSSSYTSVWTVPQTSDPGSSFPLIWAYKSGSVPSSASASITQQHDDFGAVRLDLSQTSTSTTGGTNSPIIVGSGGLWYQTPKTRNLVLGHAIAMVVAWAVAAPIAVLLGRFGRGLFAWVTPHWITQGAITTVGSIVGLVLVVIGLQQSGSNHFENGHEIIGLIVLFALVLQLTGGWWIHHKYSPDRLRRPWTNYAHMAFGMILLIAAFVAMYTGIDLYAQADGNKWTKIVFWIWAAILVIVFIGGYVLIPRQLRKERAASARRRGSMSMNTIPKDPEVANYQANIIGSAPASTNSYPFSTGNAHASPHARPANEYPYMSSQVPYQGTRDNTNRV